MRIVKHIPEILFLLFLIFLTTHLVGGSWHYFIGLLFDFEYTKAIQNLGMIFSSVLIIWVMKTYYKNIYIIFISSIKCIKKQYRKSVSIFLIVIISYTLSLAILRYFGEISITIYKALYYAEVYSFINFFLTYIILVIAEEIIFRGFLLNALISISGNTVIGILLSSLFFSVYHIQYTTIIYFIAAFWAGIIMALLFINNNSIYPSTFFHLGWNLCWFFISPDRDNPLIKLIFFETLKNKPQIISLYILSILTLILIAKFRKEIIHFFKTQKSINKPDLELNT